MREHRPTIFTPRARRISPPPPQLSTWQWLWNSERATLLGVAGIIGWLVVAATLGINFWVGMFILVFLVIHVFRVVVGGLITALLSIFRDPS